MAKRKKKTIKRKKNPPPEGESIRFLQKNQPKNITQAIVRGIKDSPVPITANQQALIALNIEESLKDYAAFEGIAILNKIGDTSTKKLIIGFMRKFGLKV